MADRHDDSGSWLTDQIEPLPPPPGTFAEIRRRARRRKYRKLAITAGSAAVVVAAAVTIPQMVSLRVSPAPVSAAQAGRAATATATASQITNAASSAGTAAVGASTGPVPGNFAPSSVTFVGKDTGWVIGQADPGASSGASCAGSRCTSVARTSDAGQTWVGVHAPATGPVDGAAGTGQVRFLNLHNGWAFGPGLFVTHDGGQDWAQVDTYGLRVTDLETVGSRVFALFASCTGGGSAFAAHCTRFTLYSSPAGRTGWAPVGAATTGLTDGAASEAASLVLTGSRGYLLGPDGSVYSGPVDGSAAWARVSSAIPGCHVGGALAAGQAGGQPAGVQLAAANSRELIAACTPAGGGRATVLSSPNGGVSWLQMGTPPASGTIYSLAASPSENLVLGTSTGIAVLPAGEISWRMATLGARGPAGGFGYVGMTTDEQGIALPANTAEGTVWFTFDSGKTWKPSQVSRP